MSIDDKLRKILINGWYLKEENGPWEDGSMQVITPKPETITKIKQLFDDALEAAKRASGIDQTSEDCPNNCIGLGD